MSASWTTTLQVWKSNRCINELTNHRSSSPSVQSDLPSKKWGTLSIAPFPPEIKRKEVLIRHTSGRTRNVTKQEDFLEHNNTVMDDQQKPPHRVRVLQPILHFPEVDNNVTATCSPQQAFKWRNLPRMDNSCHETNEECSNDDQDK